jgi:hypothetical protein
LFYRIYLYSVMQYYGLSLFCDKAINLLYIFGIGRIIKILGKQL